MDNFEYYTSFFLSSDSLLNHHETFPIQRLFIKNQREENGCFPDLNCICNIIWGKNEANFMSQIIIKQCL